MLNAACCPCACPCDHTCCPGGADICARRGGLFTVAMSKLNVRLRKTLFAALVNVSARGDPWGMPSASTRASAWVAVGGGAAPQALHAACTQMEVAFFDVTKTGDITSRLSADTSTVSDQVRGCAHACTACHATWPMCEGTRWCARALPRAGGAHPQPARVAAPMLGCTCGDGGDGARTQVCLNLNVLLRAATQASMVLGFMFYASWRLTVITLILVPCVMFISKWYGRYFAKLAKGVQVCCCVQRPQPCALAVGSTWLRTRPAALARSNAARAGWPQSELAAANAVADEVLSSMPTVKAHAAQDSAQAAYAQKLERCGVYARMCSGLWVCVRAATGLHMLPPLHALLHPAACPPPAAPGFSACCCARPSRTRAT